MRDTGHTDCTHESGSNPSQHPEIQEKLLIGLELCERKESLHKYHRACIYKYFGV